MLLVLINAARCSCLLRLSRLFPFPWWIARSRLVRERSMQRREARMLEVRVGHSAQR
jgi:hypothetical protein